MKHLSCIILTAGLFNSLYIAAVCALATPATPPTAQLKAKGQADTLVVGYFNPSSNSGTQVKLSATPYGSGILLTGTPNAATAGSAQTCQISTSQIVWNNLAKILLDVTTGPKDNAWTLAFKYGYDMPPVIADKTSRYIPAHLLVAEPNLTGGTQNLTVSGQSIEIGDDSGIRYTGTPLFAIDCNTSVDSTTTSSTTTSATNSTSNDDGGEEATSSTWYDANHQSFKKTSALMRRRVVAVGDLHGDAKNSLAVFRMAGLIDANDRWIAKDTVFVQTGDVIDRGPDTIKLLTFLESLAVQARKTGGRVIQILGNHELMNIGGETKHVSDADFQTFSGKDKRKLAFQQSGKLGKRLFKLPVVHRVADTVFAHGGISVKWATTGLRVTNRQATELMPDYAEKGENLDGYDASVLGPAGPAWYRDFAKEDESKVCKDIAAALKALGVKRMVVGHTFQKNGEVLSRCDNTFIVIDVGISQYAREAKELTEPSSHRALEILPDGTVNIITPEGRTALKSGGKAEAEDEDEDKPKEKSKDKSKKKDKGKDKDEDE